MATVGQACLLIALGLCVYGAGASIHGGRTGDEAWIVSGRRALFAVAGVVVVAFVLLESAFLRSDFHYTVVVSHSSTTTPWYYRLAAMWSSQEGSLLLWLTLLSVWSSVALLVIGRRMRDVVPYATAVLLGFGAFFSALLIFTAQPFARVAVAASEGIGLNPLLRHPSMMIHPVMLYSGYTLFTVPFAFAIGALIVRRVDSEWIRATRFYTLGAWLALGIGVLLGARWSYAELGWGGYWAWDPVENASLLPWLTGTAFLHSAMVQEKRGMLKVWNASLVLATGVLCIIGTFLVRSGILDSIHAFVQEGNTIAWAFTSLICVLIGTSVYLIVSRRGDALKSEASLDSALSREAMFLANNVVLVAIAFVVFWGTFFPLISEAVTGTKSAVGPPWFDRYIVPLALALVLLTGIGPVISWRRSTLTRLWLQLRGPVVVAVVVTLLALVLTRAADNLKAVALFAAAAFSISIAVQELWRGTRARQAMTGTGPARAFVTLIARNRRRYGGYLVHIGIAVMFVGVAASTAFQHSQDVRLRPGQTATVGGYTFAYVKPVARLSQRAGELERIELGSIIRVTRGSRYVTTLRPNRGYYPINAPAIGALTRYFEGESTSEIGLKAGAVRDLWIAQRPDISSFTPIIKKGDRLFAKAAQAGLPAKTQSLLLGQALRGLVARYVDQAPAAQFRILVSPMVFWLWFGAVVLVLGGLIAAWPTGGGLSGRARARVSARVARDVRAPATS